MLNDRDRIFTNIYGMGDRSLAGAKKRGCWDGTAAIIQRGRAGFARLEEIFRERPEIVSGEAEQRQMDLQLRAGCRYCHAILEPGGAHWGRYGERNALFLDPSFFPKLSTKCRDCALAGNTTCDNECGNYVMQAFDGDGANSLGLLRTYLYRTQDEESNIVGGPRLMVQRFMQTGELEKCAVRNIWNHLLGRPMTTDAIFNLASMTKIMASVAALSLNEEGRLPLKSRLDEYLPAFKDQKVGVVGPNGEVTLEPAKQPVYIHDLMRHTSGFTYANANSPVRKQYPGAFEATQIEPPHVLGGDPPPHVAGVGRNDETWCMLLDLRPVLEDRS